MHQDRHQQQPADRPPRAIGPAHHPRTQAQREQQQEMPDQVHVDVAGEQRRIGQPQQRRRHRSLDPAGRREAPHRVDGGDRLQHPAGEEPGAHQVHVTPAAQPVEQFRQQREQRIAVGHRDVEAVRPGQIARKQRAPEWMRDLGRQMAAEILREIRPGMGPETAHTEHGRHRHHQEGGGHPDQGGGQIGPHCSPDTQGSAKPKPAAPYTSALTW